MSKEDQVSTPEAFLEFVRNSTFDESALSEWERKTYYMYLRLLGLRKNNDN